MELTDDSLWSVNDFVLFILEKTRDAIPKIKDKTQRVINIYLIISDDSPKNETNCSHVKTDINKVPNNEKKSG